MIPGGPAARPVLGGMAIRNFELAAIQKNDPARLRTRTVETERRKARHVRSRRKEGWRREEMRA